MGVAEEEAFGSWDYRVVARYGIGGAAIML